MRTIKLNSAVRQSITQAILVDSVLECTKTSAPDVYANAIWVGAGPSHQYSIDEGESVLLPRGNLTIWIFRKNAGNEPWSAEFSLTAAPAPPKPKSDV